MRPPTIQPYQHKINLPFLNTPLAQLLLRHLAARTGNQAMLKRPLEDQASGYHFPEQKIIFFQIQEGYNFMLNYSNDQAEITCFCPQLDLNDGLSVENFTEVDALTNVATTVDKLLQPLFLRWKENTAAAIFPEQHAAWELSAAIDFNQIEQSLADWQPIVRAPHPDEKSTVSIAILTKDQLSSLLVEDEKFEMEKVEEKFNALVQQGLNAKTQVPLAMNLIYNVDSDDKHKTVTTYLLHAACITDRLKLTALFLHTFPGIDVINFSDQQGWTPYNLSSRIRYHKNTNMHELLIKQCHLKCFSLFFLLYMKNSALAEQLLFLEREKYNIDINKVHYDNLTYLDIAVTEGATKIAVMLLQAGGTSFYKERHYGSWFYAKLKKAETVKELFNAIIVKDEKDDYYTTYKSLNDINENFYLVLVYFKEELANFIIQHAQSTNLAAGQKLLGLCLRGSSFDSSEPKPAESFVCQLMRVPRQKLSRDPNPDNKGQRTGFLGNASKVINKLYETQQNLTKHYAAKKPASRLFQWLSQPQLPLASDTNDPSATYDPNL